MFWRSKASEVLPIAVDGLQLGGNNGAPPACFGSETVSTEVFCLKTRDLHLSSYPLHFILPFCSVVP